MASNPAEAAYTGIGQGYQSVIDQQKLKQQLEGQLSNEQQMAKLHDYFKVQAEGRAPELAGKKQAAQNQSNLETMLRPEVQGLVRQGGSAKVGDISLGADPYAKLLAQGPHQAQAFMKTAQGAYKGINDQLDSAQATLEALNHGNSTSDKLALINEARLAAGSGGSRAIAKMVDVLSGGATSAGNFQDKINWLQNTPNIPTMQPAQRDAIRESVFNRIPQVEQQHQQVQAQLAQQGAISAPQTDHAGLVRSFASPAQQKLELIKKMGTDYSAQRQQMQPQPAVSNPSVASPNPTTLDRLKALFSRGAPQQSQAPAPPAPGSAPPPQAGGAPPGMSKEQFKAWKASKGQVNAGP